MKKKIIFIIILGSIFLGCEKKKVEKIEKKEKSTVETQIAKIENASGFIDVDGVIEAKDTKKIFVDKKLKVKEVYIQEGDYVEKGELLMTFDETERNKIKRTLAKEEINLSKLKRNYNVAKELYKIGGTSSNDVKELAEEIKIVQLNIEGYKEDLSKTAEKIISPVSGTVISLYAQDNYSVNTDEPLLELADLSDIKILLEVPEYNIKDIKLNQSLLIKPEVFEKKKSFQGEVIKISRISRVSKTTSENIVEVEVKPEKEIPYIIPGFKVSARIYTENKRPEVLIPDRALNYEDGKYFVYVQNKNKNIEKQYVEFEDIKGDKVIIKNGIKEGDIYLLNPRKDIKNS